MSKRQLVQVCLQSGKRFMTTWVDDDPRVKVGAEISLKDVDGRWTVTDKFEQTIEASDLDWQRNWTNNI